MMRVLVTFFNDLRDTDIGVVVMRFIESREFPIDRINQASSGEKKGGGRPPYWEMVFWWTRKPLAGARAAIAGSLIPEDTNRYNFVNWMRFDEKTSAHRHDPELPEKIREKFMNLKLLDPFAGFGSIPLEAIRLGIGEVVAVEFLPTAYVFLKAILEYPKKYGEKLKEDVERWGSWIVERLRQDEDVRELYDDDVAVYIGTWEVRCPICGRYTPLVGNWWLARVEGKKRYAYMKSKVEGGRVAVEVIEGRDAPPPNVRGRPELAECLLCGSRITYVDPETGRIYGSKGEAAKALRNRLEFYPKFAIKEWNEKLEEYFDGRISPEELKNAKAKPRLLVKVKVDGDLAFEPCSKEDDEKLWKALEKVKEIWGDADIPTEDLWKYTASGGGALSIWTWGFDKFYKLFNPRQLLTLVKLVKLIREAGKKVEEEKLKEGLSSEEAFEYAEAVASYLAIALVRFADYYCVTTLLDTTNPWGVKIDHTLTMRGIAMHWNWGDTNPLISSMRVSGVLQDTSSFYRALSNAVNSLSYLIRATSNSPSKVKILLDDATILSSLNDEKFDLIVTDPPYRDDVPYVELSDFYYVWLRRALSDDNLAPRFHQNALIYNTQWESFAVNEISYNEGRLKYFGVEEAEDYYERLLGMAFRRMSELLKDDGLIVTYFAHSSPEAWIELVEAGWKRAELTVSKAWNFATESAQRATARGKTALESSIVVVWRKRTEEKVGEFEEIYKEAFENAKKAKEIAWKSKLVGSDLFLATMIGGLSTFTSYGRILKFGREITSRDVVKESYAIATRVIANATDAIKSPEALFYLASKAVYRLYASQEGNIVDEEIPAEPIVLSSQDVIILSYGFLKENGKGREGVKLFENADLIRSVKKVKGAKVAQQKAFVLLEPLKPSLKGIKEVLSLRNLNPIKLATSNRRGSKLNTIDVLHLLEYYAKQGRGEFDTIYQQLYNKYPSLVREALEVARVLARFTNDSERDIAKLFIEYIGR